MKAGLIPDQKDLNPGIDFLLKLLEERIDGIGVQIGCQQSDRLAGLGTGRPEDIEILILGLSPGGGPGSPKGPLPGQGSLLAEPGFVLEPDFDVSSRMIKTELPDLITDFFLNCSRAWGSPLGCSGREET